MRCIENYCRMATHTIEYANRHIKRFKMLQYCCRNEGRIDCLHFISSVKLLIIR